MNTDTAEAPASGNTAQAELIRSDWDEKGTCTNPEVIAVKGMPKGTSAKILLGVDPEGKWRVGYEFITGAKGGGLRAPTLSHAESHEDRYAAIHAALLIICRPFNENAKATKALEAFYDSVKAAGAIDAAIPGSIMRKTLETAQTVKHGRPLPKGRFENVPVSSVRPNPENHRKTFDPVALLELRESLKQVGQLQPIAVRLLSPEELGELPGVGDASPAQRFEIILGERRWRAHVAEEMETIEAKIYEGVSRREAKAAALIENLQRVDVNAIEEAEGYADLIATEDLTQEECAARVGRSRPAVANALRLLKLPADVLELIRAGKLTPAHGLALAKWEKRPLIMKAIAEIVIGRGTSAGELEDWNRAGGIPFQDQLANSGLLAIITSWNKPGGWDRDFPAEILTHPDYEKRTGADQQFVCYNLQHWAEVCARENAKIEAERVATLAESKKQVPKASAAKTLEDLPRNSYAYMRDASELASLLPPATVVTLPDKTEKEAKAAGTKVENVTVCLAPKFADRVRQAYGEAKDADRAEKMPAIFARARAAVRKWKKIGPRETAIVTYLLLQSSDYYDGACPALSAASAASQGVKLPSAFAGLEWDSQRFPRDAANKQKAWRALLEGDAIGLLRTAVDHFLITSFLSHGEPWHGEREPEPEMLVWDGHDFEDGATLIRHILATDDLGLLEESRAGRKQLVEKVKALPWYAEEFAKAKKGGEAGVEDMDK